LLLICGLGNKGSSYRNTRHNAGYLVLDRVSERLGIRFSGKVGGCVVATGDGLLLAKPDTYMNLSGTPVLSLMKKKHIAPEDMIVVHDDLDMPLGRMRIRWDGGDGGHKGVRSIADHLRTRAFHRMKIGIGRDDVLPPEEHVLSRFKGDELKVLDEALDRAAEALDVFRLEGEERAMNLFNR
jgi:peptidyl-tRNA hydrolase, PTH1 family